MNRAAWMNSRCFSEIVIPRTIFEVTIHRNSASMSTNSGHCPAPNSGDMTARIRKAGSTSSRSVTQHQHPVGPAEEVAGERAHQGGQRGGHQRREQARRPATAACRAASPRRRRRPSARVPNQWAADGGLQEGQEVLVGVGPPAEQRPGEGEQRTAAPAPRTRAVPAGRRRTGRHQPRPEGTASRPAPAAPASSSLEASPALHPAGPGDRARRAARRRRARPPARRTRRRS